jgi:hypothetical protein
MTPGVCNDYILVLLVIIYFHFSAMLDVIAMLLFRIPFGFLINVVFGANNISSAAIGLM